MMNKEIDYLKTKIKINKYILVEMEKALEKDIEPKDIEYHKEVIFKTKIEIKVYETQLNLLTLPTRTIKNLEVGDYVEFEIGGGIIVKDVMYRKNDHERIKTFVNNGVDIKLLKIIPHEALEFIKEFLK